MIGRLICRIAGRFDRWLVGAYPLPAFDVDVPVPAGAVDHPESSAPDVEHTSTDAPSGADPIPLREYAHGYGPRVVYGPLDPEPALTDSELIAVRQLIEERFPEAATAFADERVTQQLNKHHDK